MMSSCLELGIDQKFTRAYRPQTNGNAERFIQSALREWAYGHPYANSDQRRDALPAWNHFYNWHRPHTASTSTRRSHVCRFLERTC